MLAAAAWSLSPTRGLHVPVFGTGRVEDLHPPLAVDPDGRHAAGGTVSAAPRRHPDRPDRASRGPGRRRRRPGDHRHHGAQPGHCGLSAQSLRLAAPLALGAYAGLLSERAGVVNIAIEGMMLFAAGVGYMARAAVRHIWFGLLVAVIAGSASAALLAVLAIRLSVNQIIAGVVINILAAGVTGYLRRAVMEPCPLSAPSVFPVFPIPGLSHLPVLGPVLFRHQPLCTRPSSPPWCCTSSCFTRPGACGCGPWRTSRAADTAGVAVNRIRYQAVILGGALAGLGGAWFTLETVGRFDNMMTGGKGFIAVAAMIFGKMDTHGRAVGSVALRLGRRPADQAANPGFVPGHTSSCP